MPSPPIEGAFIKLFLIRGAPWRWTRWQELTGIQHGLFPYDDAQLPSGWTRENANEVNSYFRAYQNIEGEDARNKFVIGRGQSKYPGRTFWRKWIKKQWAAWNIHSIIVNELKEADIHPHAILIRENDPDLAWPNANEYVTIVLDPLGLTLFGEEAFPEGSDILLTNIRNCLKVLVQKSWADIRSQLRTFKAKAAHQEASVQAAFKALEDNPPTKALVNKAIRHVAKWREMADSLATPHNVQKADEMLSELQSIVQELGADIKSKRPIERKGYCKVSAQALRDLATQEDVADLLNTYHEYFEANEEEEDETPIPASRPSSGETVDDTGDDFGMEEEAHMTPLSLSNRLGLKGGLLPLFNQYRHRSGISPWEDEDAFDFPPNETIPLHLDRLRLHWHQLAGIHSIIRSIFTTKATEEHTTGVLIADEVGLGKTIQSVSVMGLLALIAVAIENQKSPPPIINDRPFLRGNRSLPSLPHLIFCPGTLIPQWVSELKILFTPHSVDIFVYDGQVNSQVFWGPSGPIRSSLHAPYHVFIIASHSTVFNDFRKRHMPLKRGKSARPWVIPNPKSEGILEDTIFAHEFLTIVVDEAHLMRNAGNKHVATLRLLKQAKDIASLGRLVGIPYFSTELSHEDDKEDAARLRKAKKLDDDGAALNAERLHTVCRLQDHIRGHLLRRTTASVDCTGKPLLDLPPYQEIIGLLKLTERETDIMADRAEAAKAALVNASDARIQTKKFYLEYRLAVGYAKEDPSSLLPSFKSLDEWRPVKSTKMDICAKICAHYLQDDRVNDVTFDEGRPIFPAIPNAYKANPQRSRRIIIYAEFPSMAPLLQNAFHSLSINGKIPFVERDKRVKEFYDDGNPNRVLVFSSVGSAGLNLAIADVVIFFDQPWSAQDERQIRGRAHRQPQDKIVKVISLLAMDSADTLMYEVARGKQNMFDAFMQKGLGDELRQLLQGHIPGIDDASEKTIRPPPKKTQHRKKPIVVDNDEITEPTNTPQSEKEIYSTSEIQSASERDDISLQLSDGSRISDGPPPSASASPPLLNWESDDESTNNAIPSDHAVDHEHMNNADANIQSIEDGQSVMKTHENEPSHRKPKRPRRSTVNADPRAISDVKMFIKGHMPSTVPAGAPSHRESKRPRQGTVSTRAPVRNQSQDLPPSPNTSSNLEPSPPSRDDLRRQVSNPQGLSARSQTSTIAGYGYAVAPSAPIRQSKPNPFARRRPSTAPQPSSLMASTTTTTPAPAATPVNALAPNIHPLLRPRTSSSSLPATSTAFPQYDTQVSVTATSSREPSATSSLLHEGATSARRSIPAPPRSALMGKRTAKSKNPPRT
ncbi:hypothetical protein D9756_010004 [Leucocoprinus leucothites]|uniref:Helicase C-terminal domain-containing protein n=1 Tax=Leucocoprinus leucothites TaxID=201217 RepID=A0A8H5CT36_9AGAR|nr:hypothetical protein D9756_010004 [Leucoagaricus leucothites]